MRGEILALPLPQGSLLVNIVLLAQPMYYLFARVPLDKGTQA